MRYRELDLLETSTQAFAEWTYERPSEHLSREARDFRRYTKRMHNLCPLMR